MSFCTRIIACTLFVFLFHLAHTAEESELTKEQLENLRKEVSMLRLTVPWTKKEVDKSIEFLKHKDDKVFFFSALAVVVNKDNEVTAPAINAIFEEYKASTGSKRAWAVGATQKLPSLKQKAVDYIVGLLNSEKFEERLLGCADIAAYDDLFTQLSKNVIDLVNSDPQGAQKIKYIVQLLPMIKRHPKTLDANKILPSIVSAWEKTDRDTRMLAAISALQFKWLYSLQNEEISNVIENALKDPDPWISCGILKNHLLAYPDVEIKDRTRIVSEGLLSDDEKLVERVIRDGHTLLGSQAEFEKFAEEICDSTTESKSSFIRKLILKANKKQ